MRRLVLAASLALAASTAVATPALAAAPSNDPGPFPGTPLAMPTPSSAANEQYVPGTYTSCSSDRGVTHCNTLTISPATFGTRDLTGCTETGFYFTVLSRFTAHRGAPSSHGPAVTPYFDGGDVEPIMEMVAGTRGGDCPSFPF